MGFIYKGYLQSKKIIIFVLLLIISSVSVKAEECKEEDYDRFFNFIEKKVYCDLEGDGNGWDKLCNDQINCYGLGAGAIDCIGTELKACDKLLNEEYQKAMKRAKEYDDCERDKPYGKKCHWERLKQAELNWIKFRDEDCEVDVNFYASVSSLDIVVCRREKTKERIKQLRKFFK